MVLLAVIARYNAKTGNKCKVKISGGINIQKLKWVGYAVSLNGISKELQSTAPLGTFTSGFQGHIIPNQLVVNLDVLNTNQVHIANPRIIDNDGDGIANSNPYSNGLPLAMSDSLNTIHMGMGDITFDIAKTIHNEIVVEVLKYDNDGSLVPMLTDPALLTARVNSDGVVDGTANNNVFGRTIAQSIILYFHYDFAKYF